MAQNIDTFKSSVSNFARPTLFKIGIEGIIDNNAHLEFVCKAANLPASTLGIIEVPYMGRKIKIAGDRTFAEWQITVMNEQSMILRKQLEDWSNSINAHELNTGPNLTAEYKHDATVQQIGVDGGILAEYRLHGSWPSELAEVDLNWESNDSVSEYTITLAYDYWTRIA